MTVGDWLARRSPAPPPALRARIDAVLAASLARDAAQVPDVCLDAAERLLEALLSGDATSRDSALDLLAADALVTYAFEAAAELPGSLSTRAADAMTRIAALGGGPAGGMASNGQSTLVRNA